MPTPRKTGPAGKTTAKKAAKPAGWTATGTGAKAKTKAKTKTTAAGAR